MGRLRRKPGMLDTLREFPARVTIFGEGNEQKGGWRNRFPAPGPLFVELGTGKGQFLRQMAQRHPEICFIGLEKEPGILLQAVRKTNEAGIANLNYILGDVQNLAELFGEAEIDNLYIHFCDPWPKSRHEKRRLTHENFLRLYRQVLAATGFLCFKTDNRALFDYSFDSFRSAGMELLTVSYDLHAGNFENGLIMTEYEEKFSSAGLPVCYCVARFGSTAGEEKRID